MVRCAPVPLPVCSLPEQGRRDPHANNQDAPGALQMLESLLLRLYGLNVYCYK